MHSGYEHKLHPRLQDLKALREAGVRTFAEAEAREAEARHREADAAAAAQPTASAPDASFTTPSSLRRPEVYRLSYPQLVSVPNTFPLRLEPDPEQIDNAEQMSISHAIRMPWTCSVKADQCLGA